ncbi:MAG: TetR/AcrR family transcriptional regulator [Parvibaculaceae bacterium]
MAGRPSKAPERRDQILDAMEICVAEQGIALSSLRRIADQSGLSLQMVSHYFGNRQSLILAFVERIADRLAREIDQAGTEATDRDRLLRTIRFLCDGRYKKLSGNDVIGREIWGLAERDPDVRRLVWNAYERALDRLTRLIAASFPATGAAECRATAYAILCLTEANEFFSGIGGLQVPPAAAEDAALSLLRSLETEDSPTGARVS